MVEAINLYCREPTIANFLVIPPHIRTVFYKFALYGLDRNVGNEIIIRLVIDSTIDEYLENVIVWEPVLPFFSNAIKPMFKLSNFAHIREGINVDGIIYPSSEHAYQAQKFVEKDRSRFSITGDLGTWDGMRLVAGKDWENKIKYWAKKESIGIIAKMASKSPKLTLTPKRAFKSSHYLWMKILRRKYVVDEFASILKGTGNAYLLEFDRGAKRGQAKGTTSIWGGIIENGKLIGENIMGKYLMKVRADLIEFSNSK